MNITPKNKKPMSKEEVGYLIHLIEDNPMITSKTTNAATNRLKEDAWVSLTAAFNAKCGSIPRHKDQLKLKWDNLKKAARKRAQSIRLNHLKTGGGKPDFIPPDEVLEKVSGLLGSTCCGFDVPFGGDGSGDGIGYGNMVVDLQIDQVPIKEQTIEIIDSVPLLSPTEVQIKEPVLNSMDINCTPENSVKKRIFFGMPNVDKSLRNKAKKKKTDDGRLQCNLAIARYYDKKTEKLELEIQILKQQLASKEI